MPDSSAPLAIALGAVGVVGVGVGDPKLVITADAGGDHDARLS